MAAAEVPIGGHLKGSGVQELRHLRLWQQTGTPSETMYEGNFWYDSNVGNKRIYFHDDVGAVLVPRVDRAESLTGQWGFNPGSTAAPFTLGANAQGQKVTGLNADLLDDYNADQAVTADTVAVRHTSGRLRVANPVDVTDALNLQYFDAEIASLEISASQITSGLLALARGGTNKDLSAGATGGLIWKDADSLEATAALTGVLIGNGASAPSALSELTVALGGTGGNTAAEARTNLGVMWDDTIRTSLATKSRRGGITFTDNAQYQIIGDNLIVLGLGDFTFSAIVRRPDYTASSAVILSIGDPALNFIQVNLNSGGVIGIGIRDSGGTETVYSLIPDVALVNGQAYMLTITFDRDGLATLYVNGISDRDANGSGVTRDISGSSAINLGDSNPGTWRAAYRINGDLLAVRLFNSVLTAAEVLSLANEEYYPSTSTLLLDLDLEYADPDISLVVKDRSSNGYHGNFLSSLFATQLTPKKQLNTTALTLSGITQNQVLYVGASSMVSGVALNTTATAYFLTQTSSGAPTFFDLYGASPTWTGAHDFTGGTILVATPTLDDHAATKAYVDSAASSGLRVLDECVVATTTNITLSGEQTIDGVLTSASRVLVKNQTAAAENGIYVSAAGAWSRATDCDSSAEITAGAYTYITSGTTNAGTSWVQNETVTTIGTDPVSWGKFFQQAAYTEGTGISISGLTISIDTTDALIWTGQHRFTNSAGVNLTPHGSGATEIRFWELGANGTQYVGFKAPDSVATSTIWKLPSADGSASHYLKTDGSLNLSFAQIDSSEISNSDFVTAVSGTADRITVTATLTPTVDIASTYVGQTSITTLGTIATGTWNGTVIGAVYGGTGQTTWTTGDLLYASGSNTLAKRAVGSAGKFLQSLSGVPNWSGYTLPTTVTANALLYASTTSVVSALATTASRVLVTDASGNISWGDDLPTGLGVVGDASSFVPKIRWFNVGDGSSTTITLTHNFATRDVVVQVYEVGSEYKTIMVAAARPTTNTVQLEFTTAPTLNQYRACIVTAI